MTDLNTKHPNYNNELLPEDQDVFKPEFKRDTRGRYFMQLPGYGKWMVGNEPGSKIISQGSEDEKGGPATSTDSLKTGMLSAETSIWVGDSISLSGTDGCIYVGDFGNRVAESLNICQDGIKGYSGSNLVFGLLLQNSQRFWRTNPSTGLPENLDKGDVFMGSIPDGQFVLWNNDEAKLYIKGDLVIEGDIVSEGFPTPPYYWLDYSEGDIEISGELRASNVDISGGGIDSPVTLPDSQTMGDVTAHVIATGNTHQADIDQLNDAQLYMDRVDETLLWDIVDDTAYYIQNLWTQRITAAAGLGTSGIIIDNEGIRGYDGSNNLRFKLNAVTGDYYFGDFPTGNYTSFDTGTGILELNGKIIAESGEVGGWDIEPDRLWKQIPDSGSGPPYTKLELNVREAAGINMHIQAFTDDNSSYTSATGVQITPGPSSLPDPRLDIYNDGTKRVMLNPDGLYFFDESEVQVARFYGGTSLDLEAGDLQINPGGSYPYGELRIHGDGYRAALGKGFYAASVNSLSDASVANSFDFYCDLSTQWGIIQMPPTNIIKIGTNSSNRSVAQFNGSGVGSAGQVNGPYVLDLFGPLRLFSFPPAGGPYGVHPGNTNGVIYYSNGGYVAEGVWAKLSTGWTLLGGGATLPSGTAYEMMRCVSGTTWQSTDKLYMGGDSAYQIFKDAGTGDMHFEVSGSNDYAFKRGSSTYLAVIDSNFWTTGNLYADNGVSVGGTIQNSAGDFICNAGNLQLLKTGAIVAVKDSGGTTRFLTCKLDATVGKYILST